MPIQKRPVRWKTTVDVRRISGVHFDKKPVATGGNSEVFLARLRFKDGKRHRVAIKISERAISNDEAGRFQTAIERLVAANVRMPKMAMMKLPTRRSPQGEWVQVSEYFGSSAHGSKLTRIDLGYQKSLEQKKMAVIELTKIALAGYCPFFDVVEFLNNKKSVVAVDLGLIFSPADPYERLPSTSEIVDELYNSIHQFSRSRKRTVDDTEQQALAKVALSNIKKDSKLYNMCKQKFKFLLEK